MAGSEEQSGAHGARFDPAGVHGHWLPWAVYYLAGWAARAWTRAGHAAWLTREVTSGRYTAREGWSCWWDESRAERDSRRWANAVRRLRRMDGSTAAMAVAGGRLACRVRWSGPAESAAPHAHPGWALRRWRVGCWIARGVAHGSIRAAALPDAWLVAVATADGMDPITGPRHGDGCAVPDDDGE